MVNPPTRRAPLAFSRSRRSPRLTLVPPTESDHVDGPMQDRRNQDDEAKPPDRVPGPEAGEPPGWGREEEDEERPYEEVVLVEAGSLRAPRETEPTLDECAKEIPEEGAEREEDENPEETRPVPEGR